MPLPHLSSGGGAPPNASQQAGAGSSGGQGGASSGSSGGVGRSQSALNFLFSKAKAFSSSASSSSNMSSSAGAANINPSPSMSSLASQAEEPEAAHSYPRHAGSGRARVPSNSSSTASSGFYQGFSIDRSSVSDFGRYPAPGRPSVSHDEPALSSPTKRSFFGGHRDRKVSNASITRNAGAAGGPGSGPTGSSGQSGRGIFTHSPLGKSLGMRSEGGGSYAQFSKSQSDLSSRPEFPSPNTLPVDLPPLPWRPAMMSPPSAGSSGKVSASEDANYLRSPSPHIGFSRSVDDLSQPTTPTFGPSSGLGAAPGSSSRAVPAGQSRQRADGTWAEHGVPAPDWGRASDVGAMAGRTSQPGTPGVAPPRWNAGAPPTAAPAPSGPNSTAGMIPFSSTPQSSAWAPGGQPQKLMPVPTRHQRRGSKLSSSPKDSLLSQEQLQQARAAAGAAAAAQAEPRPLPPGVQYQGFLSRNTNVTLSLAQLADGNDKGKEREKDISKGWKAYKVQLRDGQLHFFKPPSSASDEVKALFPVSVVRGELAPGSLSKTSAAHYARDLGADADAIKRSLGTQELLAATSGGQRGGGSSGSGPSPPAGYRPPPRRGDSTGASVSVATDRSLATTDATSAPSSVAVRVPQHRGPLPWAAPDKHPDLVLVESAEPPSTWTGRILSGSPESLAHELVFATQRPAAPAAAATDASSPSSTSGAAADIVLFVNTALVAMTSSGRPLLSLLVAVQKWAVEALSLTRGDMLQGSVLTDARDAELAQFQADVRSRVAALIEARPADYVSDPADKASIIELLESLVRDTWPASSKARAALEHSVHQQAESAPGAAEAPDWLASIRERASSADLIELARHRFRAGALLKLDPSEIAQQIQVFHADRSRALLAAPLSLGRLAAHKQAAPASMALLSFDATSPHMIMRLVLDQILEDADSRPTSVRRSELSSGAPRQRAALVRHWIAVASFLLSYGDLAGWAAVCAALCSRPVARLDQTWRYVALNDRNIISKIWAPQLAKLGWTDGSLARDTAISPLILGATFASAGKMDLVKTLDGQSVEVLPFLGNALVDGSAARVSAQQLHFADAARVAERGVALVQAWTSRMTTAATRVYPGVRPALPEYQRALQSLMELGVQGSVGRPSTQDGESDLARYLPVSLQAEPRSLGHLDLRWRPPLTQVTGACAIAPLIFTEPLPNLSLVERERVCSLISGGAATRRGDASKWPRLGGGSATNTPDSTITARTPQPRPALAGSPLMGASLVRSRTFPPGARASRSLPFAGIAEWSSAQALGGADETVIRIGAELVLGVVPEASLSLPSSPMTNKRFSQEMSRGSRPLSQASKRSSLPASNRSSMVEVAAAPLHVVVKAATLERLVDVLVMGVQHLSANTSDDQGEAPLSPVRRARLTMDVGAFRSVFLATFRRICAPLVLFDFLVKRFAAAVNASREMALPMQHRSSIPFPSWSRGDVAANRTEPIDWEIATRIRLGVISLMHTWAQRCPQDFADDAELYNAALSFAVTRSSMSTSRADDPDYDKISSALGDLGATLRTSVMCANVRPPEQPSAAANASEATSPSGERAQSVELDFDRASPQELVNFLESIAAVFFDKVVERDLLIAAELFEHQAASPTGWHTRAGNAGAAEETALPPNMYKLLEHLRQPGDARDAPSLHQRLPPALRDACAAQNLLRGWIAIHIIESRIGLERRQARLAKLLDAVWICRARMARLRMDDDATGPFAPAAPFREPTIASFVESVIVGSLTASESRIFVRAWQGVAAAREASGDSLMGLLPPARDAAAFNDSTEQSSTPDVGWILKSLAEAVTRTSDLVQADSTLVDFDKSRTVWNLIDSSMRIRPAEADARMVELAGARLNAMQTALRKVAWDRRMFKEDAAQEAAAAPPLPASKLRLAKPLASYSAEQQEKHRRDRTAFEILEHAAHVAQAAARAQSSADSAMRTSLSAPGVNGPAPPAAAGPAAASSVEKRARRVTALFRGAMRPSEKAETATRSAAELIDVVPAQKPALTIRVGSARIAPWLNSQRSHVFHLSSADGDNHLLQAPSQGDAAEWFSELEKAAKQHAVARSTDATRTGRNGRAAVMPLYNIPIMTLAERDQRSVPLGLERMLAEVEARGLLEQGIYRISGAKSAIEGLKVAFSKQPADTIDLAQGEFSDVHTIAGAIKQWFRDLPEPAVPFASYNALIDAERIEDHEERLYAIRDIIWEFPKPHFDVLRRVSEHLARVVEEGERNLMAPHNIGLVFGTSLLNPPPGPASVAQSFGNIGKAAHVVKLIITTHDWLFEPEPEPEPEAEPEGENTLIENKPTGLPPVLDVDEGQHESSADELGATSTFATPAVTPSVEADSSPDFAFPASGASKSSTALSAAPSESTDKLEALSTSSPAAHDSSTPDMPKLLGQRRPGGAREGAAGREDSIYLDATEAITLLDPRFHASQGAA